MRSAVTRLARGERARVPYRVGRQLVAAAFGQAPAAVDRWPAGDYMDALTMLPAIRGPRGA